MAQNKENEVFLCHFFYFELLILKTVVYFNAKNMWIYFNIKNEDLF